MIKRKSKLLLMMVITTIFIIMASFPQSVFAADQVNYSGGTNIDTVSTVNPSLVNSLVYLNPTQTGVNKQFTGEWLSASYQLRGERMGRAIKAPKGTKNWSNTYFICPNMISINGKKYDMKVEIVKTINLSDFEVFTWTPLYNYVGLDAFGNGNPNLGVAPFNKDGLGNGFFVNTNVTIVESGTNNKLDLNKLYFGFKDLDYHQSFSSNNMDFKKPIVREKGHFKGNDAYGSSTIIGNGFVNDSGIYTAPWFISDDHGTNIGDGPDFILDVSNLNTYNITLGFKSHAGSSIDFFTTTKKVTYKSINGSVTGKKDETVIEGTNPTGSAQTSNNNYYFVKWVPGVPVKLTTGKSIPANTPLTMEEIKQVIITQNVTFTAYNDPYLKVNYKWEGDHPNKEVPTGKSDIKKGEKYNVDTTYKVGDTVKEENTSYQGKTYPRGTWTFNGWDKNGELTINEDTLIKGTWKFIPEWNIETEAENGKITETERNIPDGENRTITYEPNQGYQLKTLAVDGEDKDIKQYPVSYPFEGINADHRVKAVFEKIPALEIIKNADKEVYNAGDTVTYTITVKQTNEGAEARNVVVKDTLPEGVTLNEDSIKGDVEVVSTNSNSYELKIKSLTTEITYTYTAVTSKGVDAEELINTAQATGENVPGEPVEDKAKIKSLVPKPEITKTVSNETPVYGEEITYTISVKEPQDGISIRNAVVSDSLPEGIVFGEGGITIEGDPGTDKVTSTLTPQSDQPSQSFRVDIPELSTETVIKFKAIVTATQGEVDNIAVLTGDDIEELKDNAVITVKEPNVELVKEVNEENASLNDTLTYTIVARTDTPLVNGSITDTLPAGVELMPETVKASDEGVELKVEDNKITLIFEKLEDEVTITYNAKAIEEGNHTNVASLSAYNFPKGPLTDDANVVVKAPKPVIEKKTDKTDVNVGESINYTITASTKEGNLYDPVFTDKLPEGITVDKASIKCSDSEADVEMSNGVITVKSSVLSMDTPITISYVGKAEKAGKHENVVTLSGSNLDEPISSDATVTVKNKISNPVTGDDLPLLLMIILLVTSVGLLVTVIIYTKRK